MSDRVLSSSNSRTINSLIIFDSHLKTALTVCWCCFSFLCSHLVRNICFFLVSIEPQVTWLNQFQLSFVYKLSRLVTIFQIHYLQPVIANLDHEGRFQQLSTLIMLCLMTCSPKNGVMLFSMEPVIRLDAL